MSAESEFNPYIDWLGIDESLLPANHYDLLGLPMFESDSARISEAADQQMQKVRVYQTGPRGRHTQVLLNELTAARICLFDPSKREAYDQSLREAIRARINPPALQVPPVAVNPLQINVETSRPEKGTLAEGPDGEGEPVVRPRIPPLSLAVGLLIIGLAILFFFWRPGNSNSDNTTADSEDAVSESKKEPPKKIVNVFEDRGILPAANNTYRLDSRNAKLGDSLEVTPTSEGDLIAGWSEKGRATWKLWVNEPGYYQARVKYSGTLNDSFAKFSLKDSLGFQKSVKVRNGVDLSDFFEEDVVLLLRKKGPYTLDFSTKGETPDLRFHSLILDPN